MPKTLARLHDSLLPCLLKGFKIISSSKSDMASNSSDMVTDTLISLRMLSGRIVNFGWKLLNYCYLSDTPIEDNLQTTSKMLPAKVEDPVIRGDIIVHTLKEINEEISYNFSENHGNERFLQKLEKEFKILNHINNLQSNGKLILVSDCYCDLSSNSITLIFHSVCCLTSIFFMLDLFHVTEKAVASFLFSSCICL